MVDPTIAIGKSKLQLESVTTEEIPDFGSGRALFRTLSPIVLSTLREVEGKLRSWDLLPQEGKFYSNIEKNLLNKWKEFYGTEYSGPSPEFRVSGSIKTRRIKIKDDYHVGSLMRMEVLGPKELLEFAYECGLGERNSMGFGMVRGE